MSRHEDALDALRWRQVPLALNLAGQQCAEVGGRYLAGTLGMDDEAVGTRLSVLRPDAEPEERNETVL
eukprot:15030259-Alexandrium_andersonii.AAC.1